MGRMRSITWMMTTTSRSLAGRCSLRTVDAHTDWGFGMSNVIESTDEFTVEPRIILDLIKRQAGSLYKALAELIANAQDGGATRVDVTLPRDGASFVVADDGDGFKDADEVRRYYKRFGFEHEGDEHAGRRVHGRFGLGRAQAWAWASTVYVTNHMEIDTNVEQRGLRYILRESDRLLHKGCKVIGTLYKPADAATVNATVRELTLNARFMDLPVYLNGKRISTPPQESKWTIEDDDAYYLFDSSDKLQVYSRGVYVCDVGSWRFGTGGMIVSKTALQLDMSRTQLLPRVCPVWARIEAKVKSLHRKASVSSSKALTDPQRQAVITGVLDGEIAIDDVLSRPLLVNVAGRGMSIADLYRSDMATAAPDRDKNLGEVMHRDGSVLVLAEKCLGWWLGGFPLARDRNPVAELVTLIRSKTTCDHVRSSLDRLRAVPFEVLANEYRGDQRVVPDVDLSPKAHFALEVTRRVQNYLPDIDGRRDRRRGARRLSGGVSTTADGWTDGSRFITLNAVVLERAFLSEAGMRSLYSLLIHEYLHSESSAGEHSHDVTFYKAFHDLMIDDRGAEEAFVSAWCGRALAFAATKACRSRGAPGWVRKKRGIEAADGDAGDDAAAVPDGTA